MQVKPDDYRCRFFLYMDCKDALPVYSYTMRTHPENRFSELIPLKVTAVTLRAYDDYK